MATNNNVARQSVDQNYEITEEGLLDQDMDGLNVQQVLMNEQEGDAPVMTDDEPEDLPPMANPPKSGPPILLIIGIILGVLLLAVGGIIFFKISADKKQKQLLAQQQQQEAEYMRQLEEEERQAQLRSQQQQQSQPVVNVKQVDGFDVDYYSDSDIKKLRELGFTGKEIAKFDGMKKEVSDVERDLKSAVKRSYAAMQQEALRTPDNLYKWTNFAQGDKRDMLNLGSLSNKHTYRQNVRYEKVPAYGLQLQLKLYLDVDDSSVFALLNVSPIVYNAVKETGSVSIQYDYRYNDDMTTYFIYNLRIDDEFFSSDVSNYAANNNLEVD